MLNYRKQIIQRDALKSVLESAPNVTDVGWVKSDIHGFSRLIQFMVNGIVYRIEWWTNGSYLQTEEDLQIPFEHVEVSGTWPNRYKTNLQFYKKGETTAVLPLEEYKEEN